MKIDDIKAFLVANLATYIAALSTPAVPLVAIPEGSVFVSEFHEAVGPVSLSLVEGDEVAEDITCNTREITLPVTALVQVQGGATRPTLAAQASAYAQALLNCLRAFADFGSLKGRDNFVGVEGNENIKATQLSLEFVYTEAI